MIFDKTNKSFMNNPCLSTRNYNSQNFLICLKYSYDRCINLQCDSYDSCDAYKQKSCYDIRPVRTSFVFQEIL